jgi:type II secretory pathway predicted ATPase ExeA
MKTLIKAIGLKQSHIARDLGISAGTFADLVNHGKWPRRNTAAVRDGLAAALSAAGASESEIAAAIPGFLPSPLAGEGGTARTATSPLSPTPLPQGERSFAAAASENEMAPDAATSEAVSPADSLNQTEDITMLLRRERINQAACERWGLPPHLFSLNDVQTPADMFVSPHLRYVRNALHGAADQGEFVAIVGESGSGKSTLRSDFEEYAENRHGERLIFIKPHPREPGRATGKPLRASQIEAAFFRALAPNARRASNPDDRTDQICELLTLSARAKNRHLLIIDEAHRLPVDTLKQLKNFAELRRGRVGVLGVALFGQPELLTLLSDRNPEVREMMQRVEVIELSPLDNDLEAYLRHKLDRAGVRLEDVFEKDAVDAIRARLTSLPRGGKASDARRIRHPLIVGNLVSRALNAVGWPKVDGQVIGGC